MATNEKTNVSVGKPKVGGAIFRAPAETTPPTDATTALAEAFINLGYISEDGVTNTLDRSSTEVKDWGGETVLETDVEQTDDFQFTALEALNPEVLKAYYEDANVTGTLATGITVTVNDKEATERVWVIEQILRGNVLKRIVIPKGVLQERGEVVYQRGEPIGYQMTIRGRQDASGNTHYEYIKGA